MDFSISPAQTELVRLIREEVGIKLKKIREKHLNKPGFKKEILSTIAEYNLVCPTIPQEYGGLGLNRFTTVLLVEEIASFFPDAAAMIVATIHAVEPIMLAGNKKQKELFLPWFTGKKAELASFALTEPEGGSDLAQMHTTATRSDEGFIIRGTKDFIINAGVSKLITLAAFTQKPVDKIWLRIFLVPSHTEGIKIGRKYDTSGLEHLSICQLIFEDALLPYEYVIEESKPGSGYFLLTQTFDLGRVMVAAASLGIARAAYEEALTFAENRVQFGAKIRNHQAIAFDLAEMATKLEMARLLTWKASWLMDHGSDFSMHSSMAKLAASTIAQEITLKAADIIGARSYDKNSYIEHLVRDARSLSTLEGTNNIQKILIASQL